MDDNTCKNAIPKYYHVYMQERLSKFLANSGLGARRKMEEYIELGLVKVNGEIVKTQGVKVDGAVDIIEFDGKEVTKPQSFMYMIVHKPSGYLCTVGRQEKRKKVHDLIPEALREGRNLVIVGRLDKDSEGLLLLTDNGELAHKMMHPSFEKEKEYKVIVRGEVTDEALDQLRTGVEIEVDEKPYTTRPAGITLIGKAKKSSFFMTLKEGKKRQVRLMCQKVGFPVTYLSRVRLGSIRLGDLPLGQFRSLKEEEIHTLLQ